MLKYWFICGGLFGFLSVAFGALGSHAISKKIAPDLLASFETAVQYQMYHALALLAIGLMQQAFNTTVFEYTGWAFIVGILLFCGSLYMRALTGMKWLANIAPVGGIILLFGWGWLLYQSIHLWQL